jgi:hypothetical protein
MKVLLDKFALVHTTGEQGCSLEREGGQFVQMIRMIGREVSGQVQIHWECQPLGQRGMRGDVPAGLVVPSSWVRVEGALLQGGIVAHENLWGGLALENSNDIKAAAAVALPCSLRFIYPFSYALNVHSLIA